MKLNEICKHAFLVLSMVLALIGWSSCSKPSQTATSSGVERSADSDAQVLARGKYLSTVMACGDCHTPLRIGPNGPEPDVSRTFSGHPGDLALAMPALPEAPWGWMGTDSNTAFAGPWGVSFAANLTPDENTGIGVWTEEIFIQTMRSGRHWGVARPILPPMPWPAYKELADDDLKAIFHYLKSLPPVENPVPEAILNERVSSND